MPDLPRSPSAAFAKLNPTPDSLFYAQPRFVAHIDGEAIAGVTDLYRDTLPDGCVVLDLMSSWISQPCSVSPCGSRPEEANHDISANPLGTGAANQALRGLEVGPRA